MQAAFQVVGVEPRGPEIEALVLYSAWGRSAQGSAQQEATWRCRFQAAAAGEDPRWLGIELVSYPDARLEGRRAVFEDCTASVLGADPSFRAQVLPSLDHWLPRISQVVGMTNIGHHGIALGDVDGDGLEDLYVCDDGGLPNRLYRQNPDGTLTDISAEAGVDFLDHSSAALLLDLDCDLDVYLCMYNAHPQSDGIAFPYHRAENGDVNLFLRNAGGFRFVDATEGG